LGLGLLGGYVAVHALTGQTPVQAITELADRALPAAAPMLLEDAVTILRPIEEVHAFCRDADKMLQFRLYLEAAAPIDDQRVRFLGRDARGQRRTLITECVSDTPEQVVWRKVGGDAPLLHEVWTFSARSVPALSTSEPPVAATEVRCRREVAMGRIEDAAGRLRGRSPAQRLREDLRRLRQRLEAGAVTRTEGQPHGRRTWLGARALERLQQQRGSPARQVGPEVATPAAPEWRTA